MAEILIVFLIGFFPSCGSTQKLSREESKSINDSLDLLLVKISIEALTNSSLAMGELYMLMVL